MKVDTSRFGPLEIDVQDVIDFPAGLVGLESCRRWVLLADATNDAMGWMQSTTRPEIAFAVVSPRRFVPDYQVRAYRDELAPLQLDDLRDAQVLAIVGKNEQAITLNLKAPLLINVARRLGRQVVANGEQPLQYELTSRREYRKSA